MQTSLQKLCIGLPKQFIKFFQHIRGLEFGVKPDYKLLTNYFHEIAFENNFEIDQRLDWSKKKTVPNNNNNTSKLNLDNSQLDLQSANGNNTSNFLDMSNMSSQKFEDSNRVQNGSVLSFSDNPD